MGSLTSNDGTITGIDTGDAIGAKVVFAAAIDGTDLRDWVSDEVIDTTAVTGFAVTSDGTHGDVLDITAASDPIASFDQSVLGAGGTGITFGSEAQVMVLLKSNAADVTATEYIAQSSGSGDDFLLNFHRISNENFVVSIGVVGASDAQQGGGLTWTNWNTIGVSRNNPSGGRDIANGTPDTYDITETGDPLDPPTGHILKIGNDSGGSAWDGQIALFVIFDEELTAGENTDFDTNPWRIFTGGSSTQGLSQLGTHGMNTLTGGFK